MMKLNLISPTLRFGAKVNISDKAMGNLDFYHSPEFKQKLLAKVDEMNRTLDDRVSGDIEVGCTFNDISVFGGSLRLDYANDRFELTGPSQQDGKETRLNGDYEHYDYVQRNLPFRLRHILAPHYWTDSPGYGHYKGYETKALKQMEGDILADLDKALTTYKHKDPA